MNRLGKYGKKLIYGRDNGQCVYCSAYVPFGGFTVEHIYPRFLGGDNSIENLCVSCKKCNLDKGGKEPDPKVVKRIKDRTRRYFNHLKPYYLKKNFVEQVTEIFSRTT